MYDTIPYEVTILLKTLGGDICAARKVRRMTQSELSKAVGVSRKTIGSIERGDPKVGLGVYVRIAWLFNLHAHLLQVFDPARDPVSQREARLNLPKRVRERLSPLGDLDF